MNVPEIIGFLIFIAMAVMWAGMAIGEVFDFFESKRIKRAPANADCEETK